MKQLGLIIFFALVGTAMLKGINPMHKMRHMNIFQNSQSSDSNVDYDVRYFEQPIDHFNFYPTNPSTFQMRYIYSDQYWGTQPNQYCKGPILFYTGNEGDIFMFFNNSGFITQTLAPYLGALVVFAEHRYYGTTMPFGDASFDLENVGYLTTEQALADYAVFLTALKEELGAQDCPVISFGGSYGGMLTAWFRLKYPHIVDGGIAASAPILQFVTSQWVFNEIVTNDFEDAGCSTQVLDAFNAILSTGTTQSGRNQLSSDFGLCSAMQSMTDVENLINFIESATSYLAMIDYPYPTDFLLPVPAWPINVFCQNMLQTIDVTQSLTKGLAAGISVFYNYTGSVPCYNISANAVSSLGTGGWDYQSCTEMVMPISSNGTSDMFPAYTWNLQQFTEYCQTTWGVTPRPDWMITLFGGNTNEEGLPNLVGSNIVFSNGDLDPWSGGGVLESVDPANDLVSVIIPKGAHHLDLRAPNPADPQSVILAREIETAYIMKWIEEKYSQVASRKKEL